MAVKTPKARAAVEANRLNDIYGSHKVYARDEELSIHVDSGNVCRSAVVSEVGHNWSFRMAYAADNGGMVLYFDYQDDMETLFD